MITVLQRFGFDRFVRISVVESDTALVTFRQVAQCSLSFPSSLSGLLVNPQLPFSGRNC